MIGQFLRSKTLLNAFSHSKQHNPLFAMPKARTFSERAFARLPKTDHYVPTEKTIDDKMQQLMQAPLAARFEFQRYQGQPLGHLDAVTPQSLHRDRHFEAVHRFGMFDVCRILPNMENGFFIKNDIDVVDRCHLLVDKTTETIVGAIFFTIHLRSRRAYFQLLEVDKTYQQQHLGKLLLHSAIYISLLYHCSNVRLTAIDTKTTFYEKCGFKTINDGKKGHYELNFLNLTAENRDKFIRSFMSVSPTVDIEQRIEDVRTLHLENQFNLSSNRFKP